MHQKLQSKRTKLRKTQIAEPKKSLVLGSVIATLIAITPYLFYLQESVPDTQIWNTFLFTYNSGFFENANIGIWVLTGKLIPLYLLFLWFFTCKHWWYHTLLVPIVMYIYQTFDTLNKEAEYVDSGQLIYLIPMMAIIIPSIYLIRARIFNKVNEANKSLEELEEEFKISPKNFWDRIKNYF
jgi:magnesium-transporting ATPase (P-type)